MTIKNLAQLKRAMQVGIKLRCLSNAFGPVPEGQQERIIIGVQRNGLWMHLPHLGADSRRNWLEYGKAANFTFQDNGFSIQHGERRIVYEFAPNAEAVQEVAT